MLSRLEELIEGLRERSAEWRQMLPHLRGRGPRFQDLRERLAERAEILRERRAERGEVRDRLHDRSRGLPDLSPRIHDMKERMRESDGWIAWALVRLRPWHAVPGLLSAAVLIVGGFWLGGLVGDHASAAVLTRTVKVRGKVITIAGARYVSTPALTVKVKGKIVHIPASTVKLPASTVISGKTVAVDVNHTVKVPVTVSVPTTKTNTTTVNHTTVTTVIRTVTGPTTTVNGPTTTVTLPGTTITVTVP